MIGIEMEWLKGARIGVGLEGQRERKAIAKASRLVGKEISAFYLKKPKEIRKKVVKSYVEGRLSKSEFEALMNYFWKVDSVKDLLNKGSSKVVGEGFKKAVVEAADCARKGRLFSLGRGEGFMRKGSIEEVLKNPEMYSKELVEKVRKEVLKEAGLE